MKIQMLGTGGALNNGLPYNSFIINDALLCETPPDIMHSLNRNRVDIESIPNIYISHLHGDHIFGLPFLVLTAFYLHKRDGKEPSFKIFGPKGTEETAQGLVAKAFTSNHPCLAWMNSFCRFLEIDESFKQELVKGYGTSIFKLDHLVDTYGFSLQDGKGNLEFAYVADTRWCEAVAALLRRQPRIVLIDLNGRDDDPEPVHISPGELERKAIPITGENTTYYGTHLKEEFDSTHPFIECSRPGMEIRTRASGT
jgi:ribonuclease BN (tRNA processing enzyme)